MKAFKEILLGLIIGLILVGGIYLLITKNLKEPTPTHIDTIQDSILYHAQQEKFHTDSARIHHEAWKKAWESYRDTSDINSAHWDTLRANYKRALEEKIRAGLTGFSDTVRSPETGHFPPPTGKPAPIKIKSGTAYPDGI